MMIAEAREEQVGIFFVVLACIIQFTNKHEKEFLLSSFLSLFIVPPMKVYTKISRRKKIIRDHFANEGIILLVL
jgi:hypothetical protein